MSRLIDADKIIDSMTTIEQAFISKTMLQDVLNRQPTVSLAEAYSLADALIELREEEIRAELEKESSDNTDDYYYFDGKSDGLLKAIELMEVGLHV